MQIESCKIELFVEDMARSVLFYQSVLGFKMGQTRFVEKGGKRLDHTPLRNGNVLIALGCYADLPAGHHFRRVRDTAPRGIGTEFCFYVPSNDLDLWYQRACEHWHADGIEAMAMRPWGARDFRVIDPDGYYLRISEPDRDALLDS